MTEDKRKSLFMKPNSVASGIRFFFLEDAESGRETLDKPNDRQVQCENTRIERLGE